MKKSVTNFLITLLVSQSCYAIDLNEALTQAYKHNILLQSKRENYLQAIEAYPQAVAEFMPKVNSSIKFGRNKEKTNNVSDRLADSSVKTKSNNIEKQISLSQSLFNGGASIAGLKAAKLQYLQAKYQLEYDEQDLFIKVIEAYLDLIKEQESYDVSDKSMKALIKQYESTQQKFKLGESTKTEVAQAKAALASARANKLASYARLQGRRASLKNIIGTEPGTITAKFPNIESLPNDFNNFLNSSITGNPDLAARKLGIQISNLNTYRAKSQLLPSASLKFDVSKSSIKNKSNNNQRYQSTNSLSRGGALRVDIPIFAKGGAEYSEIRSQKSRARIAALSFDDSVANITSNCANIWENYVASKESIHLFQDQVNAADIALEGVKQEESLGTKTVLDVLNAQNDLYKAQLNTISTKRDYFYYSYNIRYLMGKLTSQHMKLKVEQFDADKKFKDIKYKMIGY